MRECDVCESTKSTTEFTTKSPACNHCIHEWWLDGPGKNRAKNRKGPQPPGGKSG